MKPETSYCARCGELTEFSRLCAACQQDALDEFKQGMREAEHNGGDEPFIDGFYYSDEDEDDYDYDNGDDYDYDEYGRYSDEIGFGFASPLDRIVWQAKQGNRKINFMLRAFWRKIVHEIRWKFDKKYRMSYDEIPF